MANTASFDITSGVDLQEVDNAVNQAQKEISQRYDFKGSPATIQLDRAGGKINLTAENDFKMNALWDVLQSKLIKRGVSVKNLDPGDIKPAGGDSVHQVVVLKLALDANAKKNGVLVNEKLVEATKKAPAKALAWAWLNFDELRSRI